MNLNPTIAASLAGFMPRFAATSCSQCGKDTGPGHAGVSTCAEHDAPDLSGPYPHEHVTENGLSIRCFLEYEAGERGSRFEPGRPPMMLLEHAFVGLIDVKEILSEDLIGEIEFEALESLQEGAAESRDEARIDAYIERMAA